MGDEADDASPIEPRPLPQKKPSDKKPPVVIGVYENKTAQPRKSSLMVSSPGKPVRKRSVTILPPEGMAEVDTSDSEDDEVTEISHSSPINIKLLQKGLKIKKAQTFSESEEYPTPPKSPGVTRAFPVEPRPPTPPNARHKVRGESAQPRTPPSTPAT